MDLSLEILGTLVLLSLMLVVITFCFYCISSIVIVSLEMIKDFKK